MLKVAVIGLGDISHIHIQAIQANPNAVLVAVCDVNESLRNTVPGVNFYTDYHEMLKNENPDVVHNCLPHYLHYPVTKECVEKGVHVFQEKPLGLNTEEGQVLVELEENHSDVKIGVCLQNRYNESFEMLKEMVEDGEYGKVTGVKGLVAWYRPKSYYDVKPWRGKMEYAGGGSMINQSLHTLDLIQLIGGKIESIKGSISQLLDYGIEVEDTASAHILFQNGARGLFFSTNANAENSSVELEVYLERGTFIIKDSILVKVDKEGRKEELMEDAKLPDSKFYYGASHAKTINQFYHSILQETQDYVHAKDALVSMQMIDAIRLSSETNQSIKMEGNS